MESRLLLSVVNVHAGDNLQAAIDHAQPGDQLVLDAGATFTGPISLPNKVGNQWITIQSSGLDHLPAGQRVGPQDAALMPKITSPGMGYPALGTEVGAHHFRFVGIEFLPATRDAFLYDLIDLGNGTQNSLSQVPHDLKFDQCYVHTWLDQSLKRGIALNSAATDIVNSYIAGFKVNGQDSQAINGYNGPGPFLIQNNYLEAAGENVLFGGAPGAYVSISNLVPSDITIKNNLFTKPLAWNQNDPTTYAGQHWTVKNLLEFKDAQRVVVDGNRFENCWVAGQDGKAILFTPLSDTGNPWVVVRDITFSNNVVIHSAQGISIIGGAPSYSGPTQPTENITIYNNLFDDIGSARWGGPGNVTRLFQMTEGATGGARNVTIDHNTSTSGEVVLYAEGTHPGFVFTNNIAPHGVYGVFAYGSEGTAALGRAFPGCTFQGNVIVGANSNIYPSGNSYPSSWQDVGFVNFAGGDYHLAANSAIRGRGTNGTDPGANIDALGVVGNPAGVPGNPAPASHLVLAGFPSSVTAGTAGTFTVTAADASGRTATGYRGSVHFSSSDSQAVLPSDYTFTVADNGAHTFSATLKTTGTESLTATDTATSSITGTQTAITVNAAPASNLSVTGFPSSITAGTAASFTVTAIDSTGKTATGYRGSVHFRSSDGKAVLPSDYTFTVADNGVHTFSATLKTAGTGSLTATDTAIGSITGAEAAITVSPAPAGALSVTGFPSSVTAGTAASFTVTATDPYGNTATSYRGTVHFSSSDRQAVLPGDYTFAAADNGVHTFSATLKTAGSDSLTGADTRTGSITGTQGAITVNAAYASGLLLTGFPSSITAGTVGTFTVTATDLYGNTATGYRDTVDFSSSDSQAVLPGKYTFSGADKGVHSFSATLRTAGTRSLAAADTTTSSIKGAETVITVTISNPTGLPNATYHGGPLLQHVQVETLYYGQAWSSDANLKQQIPQVDGFLQYFTRSPYMDVLKQYKVGHGTFVDHDVIAQDPPGGKTMDDSQIRALLNSEINAKHLGAPTADRLYIFFTTPGVAVTVNGHNSTDDFAGYHSAFLDSAGVPVYYAVIPYPTGNASTQRLTPLQQDTLILSHEVSEAVTDPDVRTGWFDPRYGEIGDIAIGQSGTLHGYVVQGVWSQADGKVVIPAETLQVIGTLVRATAGQAFTGLVATITGADPAAKTTSFTATIDWGDGTTSAGTITVDSKGGFDVNGTKTYAQAGVDTVTVTVHDQSGAVVGKVLSKAAVFPVLKVEATGKILWATAGKEFSGVVAVFSDSRTTATVGDFTATISWGDGTTSTGTVIGDTKGRFDVNGTHTYGNASQGRPGLQFFVISVTIHDNPANASAVASSLAIVVAAPQSGVAQGQSSPATSGQQSSGGAVAYMQVNANTSVAISWLTSSQTASTVTRGSGGSITVAGFLSSVAAKVTGTSTVTAPFPQRSHVASSQITVGAATILGGDSTPKQVVSFAQAFEAKETTPGLPQGQLPRTSAAVPEQSVQRIGPNRTPAAALGSPLVQELTEVSFWLDQR